MIKPYYKHKGITIYHGDCLEILPQFNGIDAVFADPPFNVNRQYGADFNDNKEEHIYWDWMRNVFTKIFYILNESSRSYVFNTDKNMFILKPLLEDLGFTYIQTLIWYGPNLASKARISADWHFMHEPILLVRKGKRTPMLSSRLSNCFSVQTVPRPQSNFKEGRFHSAQKPVELLNRLISRTPSETILDPFMGVGTSLIAAKNLNRKAIGIEIEEKYCEIAVKRLSQEVFEFK